MMVFTTKAIFVYFKEEENQILEKKSYFEKHFRLEVVSRLWRDRNSVIDMSEFLSLQSLDTTSNLIPIEALLQEEEEMGLTSSFSKWKARMCSPPGTGRAGSRRCVMRNIVGVSNLKDEEIYCL